MSIKCAVIGGQNLLGVLFDVVELSAMQRPREDSDDAQHEHGRQGDQQVEDVHGMFMPA